MLVRNLLLGLGILCLIAGSMLAVLWLRQAGTVSVERAAPVRPAALVAARPVAAGTLLRPEDMEWKEAEAGAIRPGSLLRGQVAEAEFVGAVARRAFAAGEPLVAADLVRPSERQFLAAVLKPGTRAVAIAVDAPQSAAGLILPGDQVDVILIQTFPEATADPGRRSVAETVLRDVRVIAVDQVLTTQVRPGGASRSPLTPEARTPRTVTFELSERQAERLAVAAQLGRLQLAVRPLEAAPAAADAERGPARTWASDVSPALRDLVRRPLQSGSTVENSVRLPPVLSQ
jgi:pilus assembly protein CpaB